MKKRLTLLEAVERPATVRDGSDYYYKFSLVDVSLIGMPEEKKYTSKHEIDVFIQGRVKGAWKARQPNIDFLKVCYEFGKRELIQKSKDGSIQDSQELEIVSGKYSDGCPYQSDQIISDVGTSTDFEVM